MPAAFAENRPYRRAALCPGGTRPGGFTLIELIVVIALIGIMLGFAIPRLHQTLVLDDSRKSTRWLIATVQRLKEAAVRDQRQYVLHIDLDAGRMWTSNAAMSPEALAEAELNGHFFPQGIRILDVEYPRRGKLSSGRADITFFKGGYTDKALIHASSGDQLLSFLIEPFLPRVRLFEKYAGFDD